MNPDGKAKCTFFVKEIYFRITKYRLATPQKVEQFLSDK